MSVQLMELWNQASSLSWGRLAYYGGSAFVFIVLGLVTGYFVWRRAHMQSLDAEGEVRRSNDQLSRLQEDVKKEEENLSAGSE